MESVGVGKEIDLRDAGRFGAARRSLVDSVRQQHLLRLKAQMLSDPDLYLGPLQILAKSAAAILPSASSTRGEQAAVFSFKVQS